MTRCRRSLVLLIALTVGLVFPLQAGHALYATHDHVVSADPDNSTPQVLDGKVTAILPLDHRVVVGGTFSQVQEEGRSEKLTRRGLFAFDTSTGQVDRNFVADLDVDPTPSVSRGVEALATTTDGASIFVGGDFGSVNGSARRKLAKLAAGTGAVDPSFSVSITQTVKDLVVSGERLFVAGAFTSVSGTTRNGLAALDAGTGAVDPDVDIPFTTSRTISGRATTQRVETIALTPDGSTLVAAGNFLQAGGQDRVQIALVDVGSRPARLLDWQTDRFDDRDPKGGWRCQSFDSYLRDVDMAPDGSYFVVVTAGANHKGTLCDSTSRWETGARGQHLLPTWVDYSGGDSFTAVAVTGPAIYVGGHNRWLNNPLSKSSGPEGQSGPGSVMREGIAALDPRSGLPLPWNPGRERGEGAWAMVSSPSGLWVGSDTDRIGNEYHPKLGFFPLSGGASMTVPDTSGLPGDLYALGLDGKLSRRSFDGSAVGPPVAVQSSIDWSTARGVVAVNGRLYYGRDDGHLLAAGFDGNQLGQAADVDLRGLTSSLFPVSKMTGMFYDNGRLYYTVSGDKKLYYRYFLVEANLADVVVGTQTMVASGASDGLDWSTVKGMTLAGGRLFWSQSSTLRRIDFAGGKPQPGTQATVTGNSGLDSRGLFLLATVSQAGSPDPGAPLSSAPNSTPVPVPRRSGYWMVTSEGHVYAFGDARHLGDADTFLGGAEAVDLERTPSGNGYWIVDELGHLYAFGDATHLGNAGRAALGKGEFVTSLSATRSGAGYWIFTNRGRVLPFGDAAFFGDLSKTALNGPVLDSIPTPSGQGYYMVAADGGIFAFGDAAFHGSMGDRKLNAPIQSLVPAISGDAPGRPGPDPGRDGGYWLVASDGGVFAFDAPFRGSMGDRRLNRPMTGMVPFGNGYLMVATDGGIFNFSDRAFAGSLGDQPPPNPVVAVSALG
jgi:hypothetical protein